MSTYPENGLITPGGNCDRSRNAFPQVVRSITTLRRQRHLARIGRRSRTSLNRVQLAHAQHRRKTVAGQASCSHSNRSSVIIRAAVCNFRVVIVVDPVIPFVDPAVLVVVEPVHQEQELRSHRDRVRRRSLKTRASGDWLAGRAHVHKKLGVALLRRHNHRPDNRVPQPRAVDLQLVAHADVPEPGSRRVQGSVALHHDFLDHQHIGLAVRRCRRRCCWQSGNIPRRWLPDREC